MKNKFLVVCLFLFGVGLYSSGLQAQGLLLKPDMPTYLRQGDRTELKVTIHNKGNAENTGQVQLLLLDAKETPIDGWFQNFFPNQYFTAGAKDSTAITFPVEVPYTFFGVVIIKFAWQAGKDTGSVQTTLNILPQEKLEQQNLLLQHSGSYVFAPLAHLQNEAVRHASLGMQLAATPAAFAYAALSDLAQQPAPPTIFQSQRLFAHSIALQLWRTQPEAAHSLFADTRNINFADSSWLKLQIDQNITALTAAQKPDGSWAAWPGSKPDTGTTAQMVLCIGRLHQLKALDIHTRQALLPLAQKGMRLLQQKAPGADTKYLSGLLTKSPANGMLAATYEDETTQKSRQLEGAALNGNRTLCDSIAAGLLQQWHSTRKSMAAVYALLLAYPQALHTTPPATVQWGSMPPQSFSLKTLPEIAVPLTRIRPAAGNIRLQLSDSAAAWALVQWQYALTTQATKQKDVQQQWYLLKNKKQLELPTGSTISLGDTIETIIRIQNGASGTAWIKAGIPAGLHLVSILYDATQMWAEQNKEAVYAWLPAPGSRQCTVRMVATHRGLFYSGASYTGNSTGQSRLLIGGIAITIE